MQTRSPTLGRKQRQAAERAGRRAEIAAWLCYSIKGYYCLGRRVRTPFGEIDLVMKRDTRLAFAEAKFRTNRDMNNDFGIFEQSLPSHRQRHRVIRSALWFQGRNSRLANCTPEIEIFVISNWRSFRCIPVQ
jgi:putative endonuclease